MYLNLIMLRSSVATADGIDEVAAIQKGLARADDSAEGPHPQLNMQKNRLCSKRKPGDLEVSLHAPSESWERKITQVFAPVSKALTAAMISICASSWIGCTSWRQETKRSVGLRLREQ